MQGIYNCGKSHIGQMSEMLVLGEMNILTSERNQNQQNTCTTIAITIWVENFIRRSKTEKTTKNSRSLLHHEITVNFK